MRGDREITNREDMIDSRDIIDRIEYLEEERQGLQDIAEDDEDQEERERCEAELAEWDDSEEGEELKSLKDLQEEAEGYVPYWVDGVTLIRESYFTEYCQDMLADIGDLPRDLPCYIAIDWDQTAENLKADYMTVDFDGVEYYVR